MDLASTINLIVYIIVGLMFFLIGGSGIAYWKYGRDIRGGKMIAEIEQPNGHIKHELTPIINGGRAVKVNEFTYMLAQDREEEKHPLAEGEKKRQRIIKLPSWRQIKNRTGNYFVLREMLRRRSNQSTWSRLRACDMITRTQ